MDYEKLVEQMKWWAEECDRTNFGCQAKKTLQEAANALSMLQAENEKLRAELERMKVERDAYQSILRICRQSLIATLAKKGVVNTNQDPERLSA